MKTETSACDYKLQLQVIFLINKNDMITTTINYALNGGTHTSTIAAIIASVSILLILCSLNLLYQLNFPTILSFPWLSSSRTNQKDKETTVVFAGSFNPPHNGHLVMIQYLAMRYKEVIVVIGVNPNKKYDVLPQMRADILNKMVATLELGIDCMVRVEVVSGYIWRHAMTNNAKILFRGIRTWEKDGKEERSLHILNLWGPIVYGPIKWPLPTYFLEGNPKYSSLSSTLIRDRCKKIKSQIANHGKGDVGDITNLNGLVPKDVENEIVMAYG